MFKRGDCVSKKVLISLSLIAVMLFSLIPFVFAAGGGGGTHVLKELPPSVVYEQIMSKKFKYMPVFYRTYGRSSC